LSLNLEKNRKKIDMHKRRTVYKTIKKRSINNTENKHKNKKTIIKRTLNNISRVINKQEIFLESNNNDTTYYTKPTYSYININE